MPRRHRVPIARRDSAAQLIVPVGRCEVAAAEQSRVVAKAPDRVGRIAVHAARESHARVQAIRDVAGRHVHDPTERGRSIQRRTRALEDLDALDLIHGEQIPADAATVSLIHGDPVDRHQNARIQSLHVTGRAAQVDLAVHELHARRMIDGFVDRVHGTTIQVLFGDLSNAGGRAVAKMRHLVADHVDRWQGERRRQQPDIERRRVATRERDCRVHEVVADRRRVHVHGAGRDHGQSKSALQIGQRGECRSANDDRRAANRGALAIVHGSPQHSLCGRDQRGGRERDQQRRYGPVHVTKSVAGRKLSKSTTKSTSPADAPDGTVTIPGSVESAGLR